MRRQRTTPPGRTGRRGAASRPLLLSVATLIAVAVTASGCGGRSDATPPASTVPCGGTVTEQYASYEGVPANLNSLDVYMPPADAQGECSDRPLVVWIHGGGWTEGDKT